VCLCVRFRVRGQLQGAGKAAGHRRVPCGRSVAQTGFHHHHQLQRIVVVSQTCRQSEILESSQATSSYLCH